MVECIRDKWYILTILRKIYNDFPLIKTDTNK